MKYEKGQTLRVNVRDTGGWAKEHLATLQGATGIVGEILTAERMTGYPKKEAAYRLDFDPPIANAWKWGSPITGHWFDESEVELLEPMCFIGHVTLDPTNRSDPWPVTSRTVSRIDGCPPGFFCVHAPKCRGCL